MRFESLPFDPQGRGLLGGVQSKVDAQWLLRTRLDQPSALPAQ